MLVESRAGLGVEELVVAHVDCDVEVSVVPREVSESARVVSVHLFVLDRDLVRALPVVELSVEHRLLRHLRDLADVARRLRRRREPVGAKRLVTLHVPGKSAEEHRLAAYLDGECTVLRCDLPLCTVGVDKRKPFCGEPERIRLRLAASVEREDGLSVLREEHRAEPLAEPEVAAVLGRVDETRAVGEREEHGLRLEVLAHVAEPVLVVYGVALALSDPVRDKRLAALGVEAERLAHRHRRLLALAAARGTLRT